MIYDVRIFSNPQCKTPMREFKAARIAVDHDSMLVMDSTGERSLDSFSRPRFEWAQAAGIMFLALEDCGNDRKGSSKYKMRQVFCAYKGEK
jgi:hypothetical protein